MLIGKKSEFLLKQTRSKAKMYEYNVPASLHISIENNVDELMLIAVGLLGDVSAAIAENEDIEEIITLRKQLRFASRYFDSFYNSHLHENIDDYLLLLASASYYFGEYYGSSIVLAKALNTDTVDLNVNGLEKMLVWLLQSKYDAPLILNHEQNKILKLVSNYFLKGLDFNTIELQEFRRNMYQYGSARELLFSDIIIAIILSKKSNSSLYLLPQYTDIQRKEWEKVILTPNFIMELWPAQKLLGENDIYRGRSGVIQLPTSAGKTKAISLIIRSAFLSNKTNLVTIVAPFRALCREISTALVNDFVDDKSIVVNEISDVLQLNKEILKVLGLEESKQKTILVVTPEKLIYLFRQLPELIKSIGVLIFDEGHLFDDPSRGTVYELLVSTIISYVETDVQKILISAVISNAEQINKWLNSGSGAVITSNNIQAAEKNIAFFDWEAIKNEKEYGYLYFVDSSNTDVQEFYVPRVVEIVKLNKLPKERKDRFFPEVNFRKKATNSSDISICLAEKLCKSGGIAVFCGSKGTVDNILNRLLEIETRGFSISSIKEVCNQEELNRLSNLIYKNYGVDNKYYKCAQRGVFAHHANIANGIKISVEYAMKEGHVKLVICTSTLAQGVNLPIKYLLISSAFQAGEKIKVRDFHNLMGRTGRSGYYTEGSIILTEDFVYNNRLNRWKLNEYNNLLDAKNSENCISTLLTTVRSIHIKYDHGSLKPDVIINAYYQGEDAFDSLMLKIDKGIEERWKIDEIQRAKLDVRKIIDNIKHILQSLESFILSITPKQESVTNHELTEIVENTLAYHLADDKEKQKLISLFITVNDNISRLVQNAQKRLVLSKTLLGINQSLQIDLWVSEHPTELEDATEYRELLQLVFPIIIKVNRYKKLKNFKNVDNLFEVMMMWIDGESFKNILKYMHNNNIQIYKRRSYKDVLISDVVELCESCFGYQCSLLISAFSEMVSNSLDLPITSELLNKIARRLKYGLADETAILIYELGLSDRIVSGEICSIITYAKNKYNLIQLLKSNSGKLYQLLDSYPSYFSETLKQVIGKQ